MRSSVAVLTVVAALLVTSCGGVSAGQPTSPSPAPAQSPSQSPSLLGVWQGSTQSDVVRVSSRTPVGFNLNCSQRWEFTSQSGESFEGTKNASGGGPESDWRCDQTGYLHGRVTPGPDLTLELDPPFVPGGCTEREGGRIATGAILPDGSMVITLTARGNCALVWGAGLSSPTDYLDFNMRFTMRRR